MRKSVEIGSVRERESDGYRCSVYMRVSSSFTATAVAIVSNIHYYCHRCYYYCYCCYYLQLRSRYTYGCTLLAAESTVWHGTAPTGQGKSDICQSKTPCWKSPIEVDLAIYVDMQAVMAMMSKYGMMGGTIALVEIPQGIIPANTLCKRTVPSSDSVCP